MTLCRAEARTLTAAFVTLNKVEFATCAISQVCHCQIWFEDNARIYVRDEGSSTGTWLNGKRLKETQSTVSRAFQLNNNDLLILGEITEIPEVQSDLTFKSIMVRVTIENGSQINSQYGTIMQHQL